MYPVSFQRVGPTQPACRERKPVYAEGELFIYRAEKGIERKRKQPEGGFINNVFALDPDYSLFPQQAS
jgi:hypothetical protein